ncbi:protein-L-isoaspartate(D-aspartate) O-methyltransferase [Nocardiopsis flavescens]|uniref:Protein-L-isoaspartate O-methyltransferase n=1 Tax=Nocardiopsis flavescens TaxID=758803 RepID=A0A1M6SW07_9ACTN|nr:methyltransferase, FxLD system [Nocardiopsis flavescens]SHK48839.1 protein-L-isoaspartate(D-aspartate) O-methyltransferase [Nocardiopsis flavescens]
MTTSETADTAPDHDPAVIEALLEAAVTRLRTVGALRSEEVERAVRAVPRHAFAPEFPLEEVYDPRAVLITRRAEGGGATSSVSAIWVQTLMLERARLEPGMRVLEVGGGGYNAALIAEVVGPTGTVVSMDIDPVVTERARGFLARTGHSDRVEAVVGDAEHGHPAGAPFDRIIVTVAATDLPPAWTGQLVDGGRLVLPLGVRGHQRITVFTKQGGDLLVGETGNHAGFVPMQGAGAPAPRMVPVTGAVELVTDADPVPAPKALPGVFALSAHQVRSGVRIGGMEPFSTLQMWMTGLSGFGLLTGTAEDFVHRPMVPNAIPAVWDGATLAYLLLPKVPDPAEAYEYVACGHGPRAEETAAALAEHVRVWDREHRNGPGPRFLAHPDLPGADGVIRTRHTRLLALWDRTEHDHALDWKADTRE